MRHGVKVQIVTSYRVIHLQRYGVTVRGIVTRVYPPFAIRNVTLHMRTGPVTRCLR
jgi:hypothetical protein